MPQTVHKAGFVVRSQESVKGRERLRDFGPAPVPENVDRHAVCRESLEKRLGGRSERADEEVCRVRARRSPAAVALDNTARSDTTPITVPTTSRL